MTKEQLYKTQVRKLHKSLKSYEKNYKVPCTLEDRIQDSGGVSRAGWKERVEMSKNKYSRTVR